MKRSVMALTMGALALAGCVNTGARDSLKIQDATVLQNGPGILQSVEAGAATPQWVSAFSGLGDRTAALDALAGRVRALPAAVAGTYFPAKAKCWIGAGREAEAGRDKWGFVEETIGEASRLVGMVEGRIKPSAANVALRTSSVLRPDLWQQLNRAKADDRIRQCPAVQYAVGCAEVELMYAGHEAWTRDFAAAQARVDKVEAAVAGMTAGLDACTPPPVATAPAPEPTPVPRKLALKADATFGFDEGSEAGIRPAGRQQLDAFIAALVRSQGSGVTVAGIDIVGHTDRLGSVDHNRELSRRRANTVKTYLEKHGVAIPIRAQGVGAHVPVVQCSQQDHATLVACLEPNRRVEITIH